MSPILNRIFTYGEWGSELQTFLEAVEDDLKWERFYRYPRHKADLLLKVRHEWDAAIKGFPSLDREIEAAIDCYAMSHNLACVFHLMRVMELGVQAFGKKLKISLTKRTANRVSDLTWHQLLDALNPKLKAIPQTTARGKAKFERYSAIQSHLYAAKDAWRNPTMHPRAEGYTDLQTLDLINHVRAFMNGLAEAL